MVTITDKAAKRIQQILAEENKPFLRLAVHGGGCSGFQYALMLEDDKNETDSTFEFGEVKLIVDPISKSYIQGSEIDYEEMGGFKIKNPNAKSTCGCGQSFQMNEPPVEK